MALFCVIAFTRTQLFIAGPSTNFVFDGNSKGSSCGYVVFTESKIKGFDSTSTDVSHVIGFDSETEPTSDTLRVVSPVEIREITSSDSNISAMVLEYNKTVTKPESRDHEV